MSNPDKLEFNIKIELPAGPTEDDLRSIAQGLLMKLAAEIVKAAATLRDDTEGGA